MRELKHIASATVRVVCNSTMGTAFFVSNDSLLTAFHVVSDSLNNAKTYIILNDISIECQVSIVKNGVDLALLKLSNPIVDINPVTLLSMEKITEQPLTMFGYPNSKIGLEVGFDYQIKTSSIYKGLKKKKFDAYAEKVDHLPIKVFTGFSGSPIFTSDEYVIGIATDQLDGFIGYVSIEYVFDELKQLGLHINTNSDAHDETIYGGKKCNEYSERIINRLASRYSEKLHQIDNELESIITKLKNPNAKEEIKEYISGKWFTISQVAEQKGFPSSIPIYIKDIENVIKDWQDKCESDIELSKSISKLLSDIKNKCNEYNQVPNRVQIILGHAGVGKTQQMCHYTHWLNKSNFHAYLLLGSDFDTTNLYTIEEQISSIIGFNDLDFLEILNNRAMQKNKPYFIIIDALNEGINDNYWETQLPNFIQKILKYDYLVFMVTMRTPYEIRYKLANNIELNNQIDFYKIEGFDNPTKARSAYFKEYNINEDLVKNLPLNDGLLLSLFCKIYSSVSFSDRNKLNSRIYLFKKYVAIRNEKISSENYVDEDPSRNITEQYLIKLAKSSLQNNLFYVKRNIARRISNKLTPFRTWSHSLLYACLQENILLANNENLAEETVGFEYEQMEDVYRAVVFLSDKSHNKEWKINELIELNKKGIKRINNFIEMVCALWPEIYDREEISDIKNFNAELLFPRWIASFNLRKDHISMATHIKVKLAINKIEAYLILIANYKNLETKNIQEFFDEIKKMSLHNRDASWTEALNISYDEYDLYQLLTSIFDNEENTIDKESNWCNAMFLCLACSSSYPIIRSIAMRQLTIQFYKCPELCIRLIDEMCEINDPYILEGLYASLYGYVLLSSDLKLISNISNKIYTINFSQKKPCPDLSVREWMLRILDKDRYVNNSEYFNLSRPPYISDNLNFDIEIDYENQEQYFGCEYGSKKLALSLFSGYSLDSDFNRYILGSNSSSTNHVLTTIPINETALVEAKMLELRKEECMIAEQIKKFGWDDELGKLDNLRSTPYRSINEIERIGKKYQWLGLNNIEARMSDHYKIVKKYSRWKKNNTDYIETNYPWFTNRHSYFDPTLNIAQSNTKGFDFPSVNFHQELMDDVWLKKDLSINDIQYIFQIDLNGETWALIQSWHLLNGNKSQLKDCFIFCNSMIVKDDDAKKYGDWLEKQDFSGRWMPESSSNTEHILLEYPWSSMIDWSKYEKVDYCERNCPCDLYYTSYYHLQENTLGAYSESGGGTLLPNIGFMKYFDLKAVYTDSINHVHCIDKNNKIAAWCKKTGDNHGLYVRKDLLDEYLRDNNYSLFYHIVSERNLYMIPNKTIKCNNLVIRYKK